jgi:hypothetical protein
MSYRTRFASLDTWQGRSIGYRLACAAVILDFLAMLLFDRCDLIVIVIHDNLK